MKKAKKEADGEDQKRQRNGEQKKKEMAEKRVNSHREIT